MVVRGLGGLQKTNDCIISIPFWTLTCRGLEKALDRYAQPGSAAAASEADAAADGDQKAKRSSARESRKQAMRNLSVPERDVLLVLGAICKVCCICRLRATALPFHLLSTLRV